jgi:hypothetical protein
VTLNSDQVLGRVEVRNWRPRRKLKAVVRETLKRSYGGGGSTMNTQKVEERPKDLSILARDEEKKDIPRSILREEDERESRTREGKATITTPYFFGLLSTPRITPRTRRFPTTYLLVALSAKPPNLKMDSKKATHKERVKD